MKQICLVARNLFTRTGITRERLTDDYSLSILNGIQYCPIKEIPDDVDPIDFFEELEAEFKALYPDFRAVSLSIRLENGTEIPCLQM